MRHTKEQVTGIHSQERIKPEQIEKEMIGIMKLINENLKWLLLTL